jgi:hypothetical protein
LQHRRDPIVLPPRVRAALCVLLACALTLACREHPSGAGQRTVHIARIAHGPQAVHCGGRTDIEYEFAFYVTMVNTTADTVTAVRVQSAGTYLATNPALAGTPTLSFNALEFSPLILAPRGGEATTTAWMRGNCPPPGAYGEIQLTILVHTTSGTYAAPPVKVAFQF